MYEIYEMEQEVRSRQGGEVRDAREEAERKKISARLRELRKEEQKRSKERQKRFEQERSRIKEQSKQEPSSYRSKGYECWQVPKTEEEARGRVLGVGALIQEEEEDGKKLLKSGRPTDVVLVDGSRSADKALLHAFASMPKRHSFLLLHGIYSPASVPLFPEQEVLNLEHHYNKLCKKAGRDCHFLHFNYRNNRDFGERVCQYQRYPNVKSIVMGKRANTSELRRIFMGSSTQSVMDNCDMPVILVNEKEKIHY